MRTTLFMIFAAIASIAAARAQGKASGTLTIGKDQFEIHYAAATTAPDSFDKTKSVTRIVLTDKALPADVLDDDLLISDLKTQGYHGLKIEISEDKGGYAAYVISGSLQGTLTRSGTFDAKQLSVFTAKRVEGLIEHGAEELAGTLFGYRIQFACDITPAEPAPTAGDTAAAATRESTKSYLALVAAIRSGDKQKILELCPPEQRAAVDTPDFPKILEIVQAMTPQNIQVLKATENGDHAKLLAHGSLEGSPRRGRIYLNRVNGKWIMASESWSIE